MILYECKERLYRAAEVLLHQKVPLDPIAIEGRKLQRHSTADAAAMQLWCYEFVWPQLGTVFEEVHLSQRWTQCSRFLRSKISEAMKS